MAAGFSSGWDSGSCRAGRAPSVRLAPADMVFDFNAARCGSDVASRLELLLRDRVLVALKGRSLRKPREAGTSVSPIFVTAAGRTSSLELTLLDKVRVGRACSRC